jgi:hypothetical protein
LEDHHNKQIPKLLTKDPPKTTSEADLRTTAEGEAEAHTHQDVYTACTTATKPTTTPKIAPFTLTQKRNGSRAGSAFATTSSREVNHIMQWTPHLTPHYFHDRHTKATAPKLRPITNHTITPPLTILNLHEFYK